MPGWSRCRWRSRRSCRGSSTARRCSPPAACRAGCAQGCPGCAQAVDGVPRGPAGGRHRQERAPRERRGRRPGAAGGDEVRPRRPRAQAGRRHPVHLQQRPGHRRGGGADAVLALARARAHAAGAASRMPARPLHDAGAEAGGDGRGADRAHHRAGGEAGGGDRAALARAARVDGRRARDGKGRSEAARAHRGGHASRHRRRSVRGGSSRRADRAGRGSGGARAHGRGALRPCVRADRPTPSCSGSVPTALPSACARRLRRPRRARPR